MKNSDIYEIKIKKNHRPNEKHLEGLSEVERNFIKHMAKMIVNYVIRKVDEEKK